MLSEFQVFALDCCKHCGAILFDCKDWEKPRWEQTPIPCLHKALNHKETEDAEMKKFYYLRDYYKRPVGTVCLIIQNGDIGRGLAICSDKDNPVKRIGRAIASGRAQQALQNRKTNFDILRYEAIHALGHTKSLAGEFEYSKSAYNPPLTEIELKLLKMDPLYKFPELKEA